MKIFLVLVFSGGGWSAASRVRDLFLSEFTRHFAGFADALTPHESMQLMAEVQEFTHVAEQLNTKMEKHVEGVFERKEWRLLTVKNPAHGVWGVEGGWGSHTVESCLKAEGNTIAATWFETMWQKWKWLTSPPPLLSSAFICDLRSIPNKHSPPCLNHIDYLFIFPTDIICHFTRWCIHFIISDFKRLA